MHNNYVLHMCRWLSLWNNGRYGSCLTIICTSTTSLTTSKTHLYLLSKPTASGKPCSILTTVKLSWLWRKAWPHPRVPSSRCLPPSCIRLSSGTIGRPDYLHSTWPIAFSASYWSIVGCLRQIMRQQERLRDCFSWHPCEIRICAEVQPKRLCTELRHTKFNTQRMPRRSLPYFHLIRHATLCRVTSEESRRGLMLRALIARAAQSSACQTSSTKESRGATSGAASARSTSGHASSTTRSPR